MHTLHYYCNEKKAAVDSLVPNTMRAVSPIPFLASLWLALNCIVGAIIGLCKFDGDPMSGR